MRGVRLWRTTKQSSTYRLVIPAQAGIHFRSVFGFRIKCGMTNVVSEVCFAIFIKGTPIAKPPLNQKLISGSVCNTVLGEAAIPL